MDEVSISKTAGTNDGWLFAVSAGEHSYQVGLSKAYYQKLTGGAVTPERLIEASFHFLLEREPAGSIMPEFDLPLIGKYFPEYEAELQKLLLSSNDT